MESGLGRSKDNCSHQLNFLEGVPIPLYGNRAGKSFELVWFLLHACLVLVLTEFHLVCFSAVCVHECVGVVCGLICLFCLSWFFFFLLFACGVSVWGQKEGLCLWVS